MKHFRLFEFILLGGLLGVAYWGIARFQGDILVQFVIAAAVSVSYSLWGVFYHLAHRDLHPKVVLEYILVSLVGIVMFSMIILA